VSDRFVCIHGHFYQPPREDPWTGRVPLQPSAAPYHDWNERVAAECYGPNTAARILDPQGRIEEIVDNFSRISFDVGPTLLSWLEANAPRIYRAIQEADRESARRYSGHGSAIAQGYHHAILPLADARDRRTEVLWGKRDFEARFGRAPEGMWLPETAVDLATLEELAAAGIRFTILAPHQAARVRPIGGREWTIVSEGTLDATRPYSVFLPSGKRIAVFFYDGPASRAIAFEGLLGSAQDLAGRLTSGGPGLLHVATDGESYGHHHPHGDMALAAALRSIERSGGPRLTNYGQYLEEHPPADEAEIAENTSWSCAHGLGRWTRDCGCRLSAVTSQAWRGPLRAAFDSLREEVAPRYAEAASLYFQDPWGVRDDAIELFSGCDARKAEDFLARHAARSLRPAERRRAFELLDLQRNLLRASTSCGWFFDDVAGLEARQVLAYSARAVELAERAFGGDFEGPFRARLSEAAGNDAALPDARAVYDDVLAEHCRPTTHPQSPPDPARGFEEGLLAAAEAVERDPGNPRALAAWIELVDVAPDLPFPVKFWSVQNVYARLRSSSAGTARARAATGDALAASWLAGFESLGEKLSFAPQSGTLVGAPPVG
jgi:alpha-amylase/alpha-mannosidase (GH57 family)